MSIIWKIVRGKALFFIINFSIRCPISMVHIYIGDDSQRKYKAFLDINKALLDFVSRKQYPACVSLNREKFPFSPDFSFLKHGKGGRAWPSFHAHSLSFSRDFIKDSAWRFVVGREHQRLCCRARIWRGLISGCCKTRLGSNACDGAFTIRRMGKTGDLSKCGSINQDASN